MSTLHLLILSDKLYDTLTRSVIEVFSTIIFCMYDIPLSPMLLPRRYKQVTEVFTYKPIQDLITSKVTRYIFQMRNLSVIRLLCTFECENFWNLLFVK